MKTAKSPDQFGLCEDRLPRHVAVIMDGNGRWAKRHGLPRPLGHRAGVERLREIIRFSSDIGISALSLYAFSTENWKRSSEEISALMELLCEYMVKEIDELHNNGVRVTTMGDLSALPDAARRSVSDGCERTAGNKGLTVCFALNYGGRQEILRAAHELMRMAAGECEPLTDERFSSLLYSAHLPPLDLMIRTGGEYRLSNFMLYQAAYAELIFTDSLWPDFGESHYIDCLKEYASRNRRFGGV